MKTTQAIIFSTLIYSISSDICDVLGQCKESIFLENVPAINLFDCWKTCRSFQGCNFGTFVPDMNLCTLFQTCIKLDTISCPNCRTSSNTCLQCDFPGRCLGENPLNTEPTSDKLACWSLCASSENCNWFTYDGILMCSLFENCPQIDGEHYAEYISGNKDCQYIYSKLLVTSGQYLNRYENGLHSEVIDIENETRRCYELPNLAQPFEGAAGGLVSGKPIICGGFSEDLFTGASNKCFILGENQPIIMKQKRSYSASISISRNKLWITGGFPDSKLSTEIVTETGASIGQILEHEMYWHCSAPINNTHVILMGGRESGFKTYIYNLNDFYQYHYGPDLSVERKGCAATQIIHPNGTTFIIIVGPSNTSEILNTDGIFGEWLKGPKLPQHCIDGSMVSSSNGKEAILVGCKENPEKIYRLRWSNETTLEWILMIQKLKYPRSNGVAMLIPDALTYCYSVGQYLIAGGYVDGAPYESTEVVELIKSNSTPSIGQFPSRRLSAVGTMLGNAPLLCGGQDDESLTFDTCISYHQDSEWIQSHTMVNMRTSAAGVKVNTTTFWILGGYYDSYFDPLDSTEFIIQGQTNGVLGPKLPYAMRSMCAIKISENEIFVIGGFDGTSQRNEVWIYDPENGFVRTQGPSLTTKREAHSCSTMRDGEKILIVVAGSYKNLDSVEIYDPTDNTWHSGPSLPYGLYYSAMAESPDGRGVILFGGYSNDIEKRILELRAGADSWNFLNVTLENARYKHVVIPLT